MQRQLKIWRRRAVLFTVFIIIFFAPTFLFSAKPKQHSKKPKVVAQPSTFQPNQHIGASSAGAFPFAEVEGTNLSLYLPAAPDDILAIGYHQAYNPKVFSLRPVVNFLQGDDQLKEEVKAKTGLGHPLSFVMTSRGRRSSPTSSVDVALNAGTEIASPVDGVISDIVSYRLYGRENDFRIEITATGYPQFIIAIIHVDGLMVSKGQPVIKGVTKLARVRHLGVNSQISEYVNTPQDHVHIQVNPADNSGKVIE